MASYLGWGRERWWTHQWQSWEYSRDEDEEKPRAAGKITRTAMERWRSRMGKEEENRQQMLKDSAQALSDTLLRWVALQNQRRVTAEMARKIRVPA